MSVSFQYHFRIFSVSEFFIGDGKRGVWTKSEELPLQKKGNSHSIMVSEFLLEECGRLKLNAQ